MDRFCDSQLGSYLNLFAALANVSVRRLEARQYGWVTALEFGDGYLFTVRVLFDNTSVSVSSSEHQQYVAQRLVDVITLDATQVRVDSVLQQRTVRSARVVQAEARLEETLRTSVNYVWIAFLMLASAMMGVSALVMMRRRSTTEAADVRGDETTGDAAVVAQSHDTSYVQTLDQNVDNALSRHKLIEQNDRVATKRRRDILERNLFAPSESLFTVTLDYNPFFQLPPKGADVDPMRTPSSVVSPPAAQTTTSTGIADATASGFLTVPPLRLGVEETPRPAPKPSLREQLARINEMEAKDSLLTSRADEDL